ncbi:MAG: chorismate mutase [Oscillospiraceae bacterium]
MNELDILRNKIDKIDRELLTLFLERMDVCGNVAEYKRSVGMAVLDTKREKRILEEKVKLTKNKADSAEVYDFFSAIMAISRDRQTRMLNRCEIPIYDKLKMTKPVANPTVAFFGNEGSYSEDGAIKFFGEDANRIEIKTFENVFEMIKNNNADYGVLPIENSSTGTILEVIDLLARYNFYIVGEVAIPIRHCLLGIKGSSINQIKTIYSHEQGILQSREFIKNLGDVKCEAYYSTAMSAKLVKDLGDTTKAAIAGIRNAEICGLEVLAKNINNNSQNTTKFVIVSKNAEISSEADKISCAFTIPHESGELQRVLSCFARGKRNLLKLESRPSGEKNFEYRFFVDFLGNLFDEGVKGVINNVIQETQDFKLLGNYKSFKTEENLGE